MIRFRNPGSNSNTQIQIIKILYKKFGTTPFDLTSMASTIAEGNLMTAYGYAGDQAVALSRNPDESRNSVKMNAKMYAEVFKILGWVGSVCRESSYPIVITYLGAHIATSLNSPKLLIESTFGISYPNEIFSKTSYSQKCRVMLSILRFVKELGFLYKHEMCMSAMSYDDDQNSFYAAVKYIKDLRENVSTHHEFMGIFKNFANNLNMRTGSVDNCTRFPIANLKDCGLIEDVSCKIYGRERKCFKLTELGEYELNRRMNMYDLRKEEFDKQDLEVQNSLIRLGIWSMLCRSNFDLTQIINKFNSDKDVCKTILKGKELLFSPIQVLNYKRVCEALGIELSASPLEVNESILVSSKKDYNIKNLMVNFISKVNPICDNKLTLFFKYVKDEHSNGLSESEIVEKLYNEHKNDNKDKYYPFVETLFRSLGVECKCSRSGDNGARWDAIIEDKQYSIPVEIKSPSEEENISVKAIRQACENKIVLLSRKSFPTEKDVSTFAVGYNIPNDRSEVSSLINAFKNVYKIRIAVFGLKVLLSMAVNAILKNKIIAIKHLSNLEGIYDTI